MTWADVRRRRLARHRLLERGGPADIPAIASAVCGIHAQMMPAAELSLGMRADVSRSDVRDALWRRRSLVKTHGVRGTIHLFAADEVRLWMAARRARSSLDAVFEAKRLASLHMTAGQVDELLAAMSEALAGGPLTLRELGREVVRLTGPWAEASLGEAWVSGWPLWRSALGAAAEREVLCFGPPRGNEVTYVRFEDWIGPGRRWNDAAALAEIFRRFMRAYGPARPSAFNAWFYLQSGAAHRLAAELREELVEVVVEGERLYQLAIDSFDAGGDGATVRLLPHVDAYLRGFYPREQLARDGHAKRSAGGTGRFPVLLLDGEVAGVWERPARGRRIRVRVDPFLALGKRQLRELEAEAARVGRVLEAEAELELGDVQVRAHL